MMKLDCFKGKKILVTGHTGFKGSWLSIWLHSLGAEVIGVSLEPTCKQGIFNTAHVENIVDHNIVDIRNKNELEKIFYDKKPEIVFHLAAQALVLDSYTNPLTTFETNTLGTANILEIIRSVSSVKVGVMITTDKCYENREWEWPYRENEPMGGHDPYSASKGAAELIINSYRKSFFSNPGSAGIASARAGNVIGGGDWARNRIVPDIIRSIEENKAVLVRNPNAIRPWQYVLEPLGGYLMLASRLLEHPLKFAGPWNFGPKTEDSISVEKLVKNVIKLYGKGRWENVSDSEQEHESILLALDISKARFRLGWKPNLCFSEALNMTVDWYKNYLTKTNMLEYSLEQIKFYESKWKLSEEI